MLKYSNNKYTTVIILSDSKKIELRLHFTHNTFQKSIGRLGRKQ